MYDFKSLLDKRREGQEFSLADINRALRDAGDLDSDSEAREWIKRYRKKRLELGKQEAQAWVGKYQDGHEKETWAGWSRYLDYQHEATK
jgi:hypothetical protein